MLAVLVVLALSIFPLIVSLYLDAQDAAGARANPPAIADEAGAEAPAAPNAAQARPSKRFDLSAERPAHVPLLDPEWRAGHPYFRYVEYVAS